MHKGRLEAFSDGVLAIVITIMVLEVKVPAGHDLASLRPLLPVISSYVLSFVYVGIYWNNHHHLLQVVHRISGPVLWANLHLLFWLSLFPFVTHWMGDSHFAPVPTAAYGGALLCAAIAYTILVRALLACHESGSALHRAIGTDVKGKVSVGMYVAAIPLAFLDVRLAHALFVAVAILWLVPDRRMERVMPAERR